MNYQPGDILACYGTDWSDRAIRWGTARLFAPRRLRIGPSHLAMIVEHEETLVWAESTSKCVHPCLVRDRRVAGVQIHRPFQRVKDYEQKDGHIDIYRLAPVWSLSKPEVLQLSRMVRHFLQEEIGYDLGGALLSGTHVFQLLSAFPGVDADEIFCSQLVAAVLMRLGRLNVDNPRRFNPARLMRLLVKDGIYRFEQRASAELFPSCRTQTAGPIRTRVR